MVVTDAALSTAGVVVVGNEFGRDGRFPGIWFSPDGVTRERPDPGIASEGKLVGVVATGFSFIAVGYSRSDKGNRPLVLLSGDGRNWHQDAGGVCAVEDARRGSLTAIEADRGSVVVAGIVTHDDDSRELLVWSGPVGPGPG